MSDITENYDFKLVNSSFPHIGKKIELLWGHPELSKMLMDLLTDTRDGTRQGFPREVAAAMFRLAEMHGSNDNTDLWHNCK